MKKITLLLAFLLGIISATCFAQENDISKLTKLAEQGDVEAQNELGVCYDNGDGVPQNYDEAKKWFGKAAAQGYAVAQRNLGICYGREEKYEEAVKWYKKAAEQSESIAQNNLGVCYYYGLGVSQNYEEALKWYEKAADNGYWQAYTNVDWYEVYGEDYSEYEKARQNALQKAKSCYMKEVNKGNTSAMIAMGDLYSFYDGYFPDIDCEKAAITWYNLAVDQGNPDAIAALAALYDRRYDYPERLATTSPGPTRLKDYEKDVPEYDNSAIVASVKIERDVHEYVPKYDSMRNDTLKLYTERLWQLAADKGSARAQAIIGFKCFLEKKFEKAMEWYAKAKKNGSTKVWRVVNVNLPIDMAIMLCEHFNEHSSEYDFYYQISRLKPCTFSAGGFQLLKKY